MQDHQMKLSRRFWFTISATGSIAAFVFASYSGASRVEVVHHDLRASTDLVPIRLVQISDSHLKAFGSHEQGLVATIVAQKPDVVVLSGDAVDRIDALPLLQSFVKSFAPVPVLLVPGNWEHWSGLDFGRLQSTLSASGAKLLLNDHWSFSRSDRSLQIIGLDDFTAGQPDLHLLRDYGLGKGGLTVVVQHSPAFFDQDAAIERMAKQPFDLCLSGHTHGGQITLGGWAPIRPVGSGRFVSGFYDVPGCPLFVSSGAGTSVVPLRLGARAEVVIFDL